MNFNPTKRIAPTATVPAGQSSAQTLEGLSLTEVVQACQQKITAGNGKDRAATGATFLNMLTPKVFAADPESDEMHAVPMIYANFDNKEDSVAVKLAEHLSTELLNKGEIPELQYFFKLICAQTKSTIATDMPEYEPREEADNVPAFLKPEVNLTSAYVPPADIAAYLHIYAEQNGRPVRIASNDIPMRNQSSVATVSKLAANGVHLQAGVVPQNKVINWLSNQALASALQQDLNINDFSKAATS